MSVVTARLQRRFSPAARWSRRLGAFSVVLLVTSALAHRFGMIETVPFLWLLGLCFLLGLLGLMSAIAGFAQFWEYGMGGMGLVVIGGLLSLLALSPYAVSAYRFALYPQLTDITTDVSRPPLFNDAKALRRPPMNELEPVSQARRLRQVEAYPELVGRRYEHTGEIVLDVVTGLVADRGWEILGTVRSGQVMEQVTVEAVARTYLLGFPNDVAIRIEERAGSAFVDMRSVSRYGQHDLGDNAMRIKRFLSDLDARIEALGSL